MYYFLMLPISMLLLHSIYLFSNEYKGYHKPRWLQVYSLFILIFTTAAVGICTVKGLESLGVSINYGAYIGMFASIATFWKLINVYTKLEKDT